VSKKGQWTGWTVIWGKKRKRQRNDHEENCKRISKDKHKGDPRIVFRRRGGSSWGVG